jgi:hypothetical protein
VDDNSLQHQPRHRKYYTKNRRAKIVAAESKSRRREQAGTADGFQREAHHPLNPNHESGPISEQCMYEDVFGYNNNTTRRGIRIRGVRIRFTSSPNASLFPFAMRGKHDE